MFTILGVDIGGTHTDAVLIDEEGRLLSRAKTKTLPRVHEGVEKGVRELLDKAGIHPKNIREVKVGTTHATNALLEGKSLLRVGVIRLTGKREPLIPSAFGFPSLLVKYVVKTVMIPGGMEYDGRERDVLVQCRIDEAVSQLLEAGVQAIVISGSFSPLHPEHEKIVRESIPKTIPVSCSFEMSGLGFIERENTAILNALLRDVLKKGFSSLRSSFDMLGIEAPLFLTHNEGSVMSLEEAIERPILTLSSGQTNSFIGAARLLGLHDAVVVDIGGTTTDIGVIVKGFPRKTLGNVDIAGIPLNFPMPDVISIALGGGSIVNEHHGEISIGPKSCGGKLFELGKSFGGDVLTLTDLAVCARCVVIKGADPEKVPYSPKKAKELLRLAFLRIKTLIDKLRWSTESSPVVVVGGGALLFRQWFEEEGFFVPEQAAIANAYGAALAEIAFLIDTTVTLDEDGKKIELLKEQVIRQTILRGASSSSVRLTRLEILPYHYMAGRRARVVITAAGKSTGKQ